MPQRPWIEWDRWWTPLGAQIHIEDGRGFLRDPTSEFAQFFSSNVFPLEQLVDRHCLVLCGEPGMGKTAELNQLRARLSNAPDAHDTLEVNFRSCLDSADFRERTLHSDQWKEWMGSQRKLRMIIDGVDEGLWLIPNFLEWLIDALRDNVPLDRLSVILACRTLEWPQTLGGQLASLWGEPVPKDGEIIGPAFELCPLTRQAARKAAEAHQLAPIEFLQAVQHKQVEALAARPMTLFMLIDEFQERGGEFAHTHRELYLDCCRRLCREPDAERANRMRKRKVPWVEYRGSQLEAVAGRIAAMMLLSARNSVLVGNEPASSTDLPVHAIEAGAEYDDVGEFPITEDLVQATLASGLFNAKGSNRFGFEHQTFAECLAAQYLAKVELGPLRTLLCRRDAAGEYVIPQLAELTSWLAAERSDVFDHLLSIAPEILLRTDLAHLNDALKHRVVAALLKKAADAEYFERHDRKPFYAALCHAGLAPQLRAILLDRKQNNVARWLALDIATACKCHELFPDLLVILKRRNDPISRQAGFALDDLVTVETAPQLIPIVKGTFRPQQPRSVRACALRGLVATIWSVAEAVAWAKEVTRTVDFLDWYLAERANPADVKPSLRVLSECEDIFDSLFRLRKLAARVCKLALDQLDDNETKNLLGIILFREMEKYHLQQWQDAHEFGKAIQTDQTKRRTIILAIYAAASAPAFEHRWQIAQLCAPEDLLWLADCASRASPTEAAGYIETLKCMMRPELVVPQWDEFLLRVMGSKRLRPFQAFFAPLKLQSRIARKARSAWRKSQKQQERYRRIREEKKLPLRDDLVNKAFAAARDGVAETWVRLSQWLFITDSREWASGIAPHDIAASPGWVNADDKQREKIRAVARSFLTSRTSEIPRRPNQATNFSEAAFSAAWLLRDEWISPGPLRDAVTIYCVPAIVWSFCGDDSAVAELTTLLYSINPVRCRQVFLEKLRFDAETDSGLTLAAQPFLNCWDSELSKIVEDFLLTGARRPETVRSLLQTIARVDMDATLRTWRGLAKRHINRDKASIARTGAATELVLHRFPADAWNDLYPFLRSHYDITRIAVQHSSYYGHFEGVVSQTQLTEQQLAELYLLLYRVFPPSDPEERWPDDGEPHHLTSRHDAARFRDSLLDRLVARGTTAACNQLTRITSRIAKDERLWMRKRWLDCMELVRRKRWNPPGTDDVLELARRRNSFWIEDEDDLLLAVTESLDELQSSLQSSPSGDVIELWTYKRKGTRLHDFQPKSEIDVARKIYSWLRGKLGGKHGAIVNREVAIQWDQRRTDIDVIVTARAHHGQRELAITIEVKRAWNARVALDARKQLKDRYLVKAGRTHGLYLVAWFECHRWKPVRRKLKARTIDAAKREVAGICRKAESPGITISSYVLDCGLPS